MAMTDLAMTIDASRTRAILGWEPRPRLQALRRLPFLLENRRTDPIEWNRANRAAMKEVHLETNLRIFALLTKHAHEIALEYTEVLTGPEGRGVSELPAGQEQDHRWNPRSSSAPDERGEDPGAVDPSRTAATSRNGVSSRGSSRGSRVTGSSTASSTRGSCTIPTRPA
jgi:hypothetical protein